jgi:DNA mismatch endonuclease (patch repair protein)
MLSAIDATSFYFHYMHILSIIMSHISGIETKPEVLIRMLLFAKGFRFRKNVKSLRAKPDIVFTKYKTIIFIHGCFWHGHEACSKAKLPDTRREFWKEKTPW